MGTPHGGAGQGAGRGGNADLAGRARSATARAVGHLRARRRASPPRLSLGRRRAAAPGRVRLSVRKGTAPTVGQFVELKARLHPPLPTLKPGSYDFSRDLYFQGIG